MKTLDCEKFLSCILAMDDTEFVNFLNDTGYAGVVSGDVEMDTFKKFISFMTADRPEEIAKNISLDDLAKMAHSVSEFGEVIAGNLTIAYFDVRSKLQKMRSAGRRLL